MGHKGLFFERLDAPVTGANALPPLTPESVGFSFVRNRILLHQHGRWAQGDPNATGAPIVASGAYHGTVTSPIPDTPRDTGLLGEGSNLHAYVNGDPVRRADPLGLFDMSIVGLLGGATSTSEMEQDWAQEVLEAGVSMRSSINVLFEDYALAQLADFYWADNWGRGDDDYSSAGVSYSHAADGGHDGTGPSLSGYARFHHIATNKNWKRGGKWTPKFKELFARGNMTLGMKANMMEMTEEFAKKFHSHGAHAQEYHRWVYQQLKKKVGGKTSPESVAKALVDGLREIEDKIRKDGKVLRGIIE